MTKAISTLAAVVFAFYLMAAPNAQELGEHDKLLPIEIASDNLKVNQQKQLAVFTGNVEAKQGKMRLRAHELRVHYVSGSNNQNTEQAISKINASGKVFFSTENETAQGNEGVYDVEHGMIFISGSVILTQGENVIRGEYLVLDLRTGENTMKGNPSTSKQKATGGRVRGLFVPGPRKRAR